MTGKEKKNQIIVLEPSTASVTELLGLVREKSMAEVVTCATPEEAIQSLSGSLPCLLITSLTDNAVVPLRVQLLKRLESVIKQGALKVYMVTGMKNRQLADLFTQKLGVADYIIDPVPARTMLFKVNLALKAVDNFRKMAEQKKAAQEQIVIKKGEAKKADAAPAPVAAKGKPALQMAEDTFLFKNGGVKKAGKKFVVEVEGPDPSTGEWKQHEDKGDAQSAWRWVPNEEKAAQEAGKAPPDGWVHAGDKPVFNEETGKWALSSEKPQLALKKAGQVVAEKVSLDEKGEVVVAEDSPAAEANVRKNREKAAVAIKAREEKKKAEREQPATKEPVLEVEKSEPARAEEAAAKQPGKKTAVEAKNPKAAGKNAPKAKLSLAEQLGDDEGDDTPAWKEEKGEFHNKTGGKKEELRSVQDRRGEALEEFGETKAAPAAQAAAAAEARKPASPLDFLKKKKEQLQKDGKAKPEGDDLYGEGEEGPAAPGAGGPALHPGKEKKKKASAIDKLARLKAGLAEEDDGDEGEGWQEETGEFHNKTGGKKDELRSVQDRRGGAVEKFGERKAAKKEKTATEEAGSGGKDWAEKAQAKLAVKKAELAKVTAKLREPLPETLGEAEEEQLREELGLKNRPEIKARELAKRKRAAEAERVKALMAEIEDDERSAGADEESGEVISSGLRSEVERKGEGPRAHDLSKEKLKGIRGAIDGGDLGEFGEDAEERRKKGGGDTAKARGSAIPADQAVYVPEAELLPKGNAWEACSGWYVYLQAETRYKGFSSIDDLLPLWVFQGDKVPELLGKTKQWRFFGGHPTQVKKAADVPKAVLDYLLGIQDQLASAGAGKEEGEAAASSGTKEKKKKKGAATSMLDRLKQELADEDASSDIEEDPMASPEAPEGASAEPGKAAREAKPRKSPDRSPEPFAEGAEETAAGDSGSEMDGPAAAAAGPGKGKPKKDSGNPGLDALKRLREKMKAGDSLEPGDEAPAAGEPAAEKESRAEEGRAASALERLRKQLEQHENAPDEEAPATGQAEEPATAASTPQAEKRERAAGKMSELERLRRELEGEDLADNAADEDAGAGPAAEAQAARLADPGKEKTKASPLETATDEAGAEPQAVPGAKEKKKESPSDAMKRLREQLLKDAPGEPTEQAEAQPGAAADTPPADETPEQALARLAGGEEKPQFGGDRNEQMRRLREKLAENTERAEAESPPPAAAAPAVQSEGVKKFLERRKNKNRGVEKTSQSASEEAKAPAFTVYLGLFVAVSDALGQPAGSSGIPRVLKAFEDSFGRCRAFYTETPGEDGMANVRYSSGMDNGTESAVKLESGRAEAITSPDGGGQKVMGYLFLQPESGRDSFGESETEALRKVAAMLWPVLAREPEAENKVA